MRKTPRGRAEIPFIDVLIAVVFLMALLITVAAKKQDATKPDPKVTIFVSWTEGLDVDMDPYVLLPSGDTVFYRDSNLGGVYVDHDDLGTYAHEGMLNLEIVKFNEGDGDYYVSTHLYGDRRRNGEPGEVSVAVYNAAGDEVCFRKYPVPSGSFPREAPAREEPLFKLHIAGSSITCSASHLRLRSRLGVPQ